MDNLGVPDLSGLIGNMLSDPETLKSILNVASSLKSAGVFSSEVPREKEEQEERAYGEEAEAYTVKNGRSAPEQSNQTAHAPSDRRDKEPFARPPLFLKAPDEGPSPQGRPTRESDRRRELLRALRPYLSRERQEKLDGILQIFAFLELAESFGGLVLTERGREGGT